LDGGAARSAVLDGVFGWESNGFMPDTALDPLIEVLDSCAADTDCRAAFPDLEAQLTQLLENLNDISFSLR
jgi:pyruvate-formate lyase-activating enzyme